jgi:hypothetical protein
MEDRVTKVLEKSYLLVFNLDVDAVNRLSVCLPFLSSIL